MYCHNPTIGSLAWISAPAPSYTASSSVAMTSFSARLLDAYSNLITTNSATTVTVSRLTGSGTLGGTLTRTVSSGLATFNDITYTVAESPMVIKATENTSNHTVASSDITVAPAAVASVAWGTAPAATYTASSSVPMASFTARLLDAFSNIVTTDSSTTVTLSRTGTGTLGGTLVHTVASGVATFTISLTRRQNLQ